MPAAHILSKEHQMYYERVTGTSSGIVSGHALLRLCHADLHAIVALRGPDEVLRQVRNPSFFFMFARFGVLYHCVTQTRLKSTACDDAIACACLCGCRRR